MDDYLRGLRREHRFLLHLLTQMDFPDHIFLAGSIAQMRPRPADLDVVFSLRGLDLQERRRLAAQAAVMLQAARMLYGWCDPFVLTAREFQVRNANADGWEPSRLRPEDVLSGALPLDGLNLQDICPELYAEPLEERQRRVATHIETRGRARLVLAGNTWIAASSVCFDPEQARRENGLSDEQVQACMDWQILSWLGFLDRQSPWLASRPNLPPAQAPALL